MSTVQRNVTATREHGYLTDLRLDNFTASRCRPLRRRRFNTLRPPGERMRLRNPWVFSRLRTLGCHVRFGMISSLVYSTRIPPKVKIYKIKLLFSLIR